jgi:tetratricopeptide (TPR) repeat protein
MLQLRIALCLLFFFLTTQAQTPKATVREYQKVFKTYPYSDPNPIPTMGKIYPYFRYDGYTDKPVNKEWKVIELENEFIKVMILPEIGGKIWTAIEKASGQAFIYNNQVIKFRDIAMRGPWTSGGIEANYGIIGHTPAVSSPVDYLTKETSDGVSCSIGVLDLLTRTPWRLEIHLPNNKAYFTTTSFWYNATPIEQPYYSWMNAGIKAKGNLQFIYPGTHYLGHDGEYASWPINKDNGKDISFYENNNFGGYKSYHVFGKYADFFGGYWHDEDFGMARYSTHDDKAGKKIWIWGLSPQGMIWEKLLTDSDGQYVEVQSGRLFNQAAERSMFTPFKHRGFAPYASDTWTEYWFPVKGTKGFIKANPYGALNVKEENGAVKLYFSPLQTINDKLEVFDGANRVYEKQLVLKPLQTFSDVITAKVNKQNLRIVLGGNKLEYLSQPEADTLARPLEMPKDFDWNSVYGLWLQGKENLRQRFYAEAQTKLEACLQKDPNYAPALVDLAMLEYRNLNYDQSLSYAKRALSIDTYDPAANYYYGLANVQLSKITEAKDGFDLAAQSAEFRSAAYLELAKIYCAKYVDQDKAIEYANKSLAANSKNIEALKILVLAHWEYSSPSETKEALRKLYELDPMNPFPRVLNHVWMTASNGGGARGVPDDVSYVKNEMPQETFLEQGISCCFLGKRLALALMLSVAPQTPEILYWQAFYQRTNDTSKVAGLLQQANSASPAFVFPHRPESIPVFEWAIANSPSWKPKYYLGLIYWSRNNFAKASELWEACGNEPEFAPFYAARAELRRKAARPNAFADLQRAAQLDPQQWRFGKLLVERFIEDKQYSQALQTARASAQKSPDNYQIGMLHAKTLLLNQQYQACSDVLAKLNILPYEGATDGRRLYRETQLMLALEQMKAKDYAAAQRFIAAAREWPENLGAGKPYPEDVDERLEDWLAAFCAEKLGKTVEMTAALTRIITFKSRPNTPHNLVIALAYQKLNRPTDAKKVLLTNSTTSPLSRWAEAILRGQAVPTIETNDEQIRVLSEWAKLK